MTKQRTGLIVELRGDFAAALTPDGEYVRVINNGYEVGETISLGAGVRAARSRARVSALASVAAGFLLLFFAGFTSYVTPTGVVSLDVNPSIEYTINCYDRVLRVDALNGDGAQIIESIDPEALVNRAIDDAVDATILQLQENGYLKETAENDVVLSASSYTQAHAEKITARLMTRVSRQNTLTVYAIPVEKNDVNSAHALGTSAGKLYLIEQLGDAYAQGESFDPKDWVTTPVREIIAETKEKAARHDNNANAGKSGTMQPENGNNAGKNTPSGATNPTGGTQSGSGAQGGSGAGTPGGGSSGGGGTKP